MLYTIAKFARVATITGKPGAYYVMSEKKNSKGKRKHLGGPYGTRAQAEARLKDVEMFKHMKNK